MIKTYAIKGDEKVLVTSQNKDTLVGYTFIQEEMTEEEILQNKKTSLLKEIGELKTIKDGMELVGDDITETTAKINTLISEYKSL